MVMGEKKEEHPKKREVDHPRSWHNQDRELKNKNRKKIKAILEFLLGKKCPIYNSSQDTPHSCISTCCYVRIAHDNK